MSEQRWSCRKIYINLYTPGERGEIKKKHTNFILLFNIWKDLCILAYYEKMLHVLFLNYLSNKMFKVNILNMKVSVVNLTKFRMVQEMGL